MEDDDRLAALLDTAAVRAARRALSPPVHLVGGCLRDALLGVPCHDLDLVIVGDDADPVRRLADLLDARLVDLSGGRFPTLRLVTADVEVDVWSRGDTPIEDELARRDLTINALAWDLHEERFVDPCGGLEDIERGGLRPPRPDAFDRDPLRVLRLARFRAQLPTFEADRATRRLARAAAPKIVTVAHERVRDELATLFAQSAAVRGVDLAIDIGLCSPLCGTDPPRDMSRQLLTALTCIADAERAVEGSGPGLPPVDRPLARSAVTLRAAEDRDHARAALHDRGYLTRETDRQLRPLLDVDTIPTEVPLRRRFLHRTGRLWSTAATVIVAERLATDAPTPRRALSELARLWREDGETIVDPPHLVRGDEVAAILGLEPGPALGDEIERLRRLQVDGVVTTREEALARLRQRAEASPGSPDGR